LGWQPGSAAQQGYEGFVEVAVIKRLSTKAEQHCDTLARLSIKDQRLVRSNSLPGCNCFPKNGIDWFRVACARLMRRNVEKTRRRFIYCVVSRAG
jgi:hypothetical protein